LTWNIIRNCYREHIILPKYYRLPKSRTYRWDWSFPSIFWQYIDWNNINNYFSNHFLCDLAIKSSF
jgi:hypothetical protein